MGRYLDINLKDTTLHGPTVILQPIRILHSIIELIYVYRFLIGQLCRKIKLTPKRFMTASPDVHYFGYHVLEIF